MKGEERKERKSEVECVCTFIPSSLRPSLPNPPSPPPFQTHLRVRHPKQNLQENRHNHGKPINDMSVLRLQTFLKFFRAQNDDHPNQTQDEGASIEGSVSVPELGAVLNYFKIIGAEVCLSGRFEGGRERIRM